MKYRLFPWLIGFLLLVVVFLASSSAPVVSQPDVLLKQNQMTFNAPFTLRFSHIMHRPSVEDAFMIVPEIPGQFHWKDFWTLEFLPDAPLNIGDKYRIIIRSQARNIWMKKVGYDTPIDYLVTGPPYVLFAHPPMGEIITKEGAVTVMFDRPMDLEGKKTKDLIESDPAVEGHVELLGKSAFQFFPKNLKAHQTYEITVPPGLPALDGGKTEKAHSWLITTSSLKAEKAEPSDGAGAVAVTAPIKIYFDAEIPLENIKPGLNALLYPSNDVDADVSRKMDGFFNTEVTYEIDSEGRPRRDILVFTPTFAYLPDVSYRFILKSDKDLHLEEDFELSFTTAGSAGPAPETVASEEPAAKEEVSAPPPPPFVWKDDSLQFFIRGEQPRLQMDEPPSKPFTLSVCQISSNEFIRLSAGHQWGKHQCDTTPVSIEPNLNNPVSVINLADHFSQEWVTGVYYVSITQDSKKAFKHFLIKDSTLLLKRSENDLLVWALDTKSGKPIDGMELEVLSYDGDRLMQGKTDTNGIFAVNRAFEAGLYVRGKKEGTGISRWGLVWDGWFLDKESPASIQESPELFVLLNQDIFSPGEDVRFEGVWRTVKDHLLALPDASQVTVSIEDSWQNPIVSKRIPMRRNGSFDGFVTLPDNLPSDVYRFSVSDLNLQRLTTPLPFQIRRSSPEITLEWLETRENYVFGSAPATLVKARYQNGLSAGNATGSYSLFRRSSPTRFEEGAIVYSFTDTNFTCDEKCRNQTLVPVKHGEFSFDENGEARLFLTEEGDRFLSAGYQYELRVSVESGSETAMLNHAFRVNQGEFKVGLGLKHALVQVNEPIEASVLALSHTGAPRIGKKLKLTLLTSDSKRKIVYEGLAETGLSPVPVQIAVSPTMEDGVYILRAEGRDDKRNSIVSEQWVYLNTNPLLGIDADLLLAADQPKYFVGGRAHLLVNEPSASIDSPVSVVVTYERDGLLGFENLELTSPVTRLSVPIKESMMPSFLVTVTRFNRGVSPYFSTASQRIDVGRDESRILMDFDFEPKSPKPGEELVLKFRTYDFQNRPLSSVITLNVLDGETASKELSYESFFAKNSQPLPTASNLSPARPLPAPVSFTPADALFLKPSRSLYFDPLISTTVRGEAEVRFLLPEVKESLVIQAFAVREAGQFGHFSTTLPLHHQLRIRPVLPAFLVPGEQTHLTASIQNISNDPLQGSLRFSSPDIIVKGDMSRNFSLQPGQQTEIAFSVSIDSSLTKDKVELSFGSGPDSFETAIPLKHLKTDKKIPHTGLFTDDVWTGRIEWPKEAYRGSGSLRLTMSGSPLSVAMEKAETLKATPYESNYFLAAELLTALSLLPDPASENALVSIRSMVSQLLKKADGNGRYRFWNETSPSPRLSALVLLVYAKALEKNVHIDSMQINRTVDFLWKTLETEALAPDDQSFILWTLAENDQYDTERSLELFKERESLSANSRFFLLLTLEGLTKAGQSSVTPLMDRLKAELLDMVIEEGNGASLDNNLLTTALALYTLSGFDAEHPLLRPMADFLAYSDDDLVRGSYPEAALWSSLALKRFTDSPSDSDLNFIARVKLNGNLVLDQSVTQNSAKEVHQVFVEGEKLKSEAVNEIFIKKDGSGSLYLTAHLTSFSDPALIPRQEDGVILIRRLFEIPEKGVMVPATAFRRGKAYVSELHLIVPRDYHHVALTDELPAGFRLIQDSLELSPYFSQNSTGLGKITYYAPHLPAGIYKLSTPMQAVLSGTFKHFPASFQAIFEPEILGLTEGGVLQILD